MVKIPFILTLLFCSIFSLSGQDKINWLTWEEAMEKNKVDGKKIVVDVYTEWCGWCKKMDKATFENPMIVQYINENYHAVKFDAERKKSIVFNEKEYKFIRSGRKGYHELAFELLGGRLSYPTVVFLDENSTVIQPIKGYQDSYTFDMIMRYFAEDHFKKTPWKKFTADFKPQAEAIPVKGN